MQNSNLERRVKKRSVLEKSIE